MANEQLFHIGVKALIQNAQGQILLLKADTTSHKFDTKPYWDIPGGRIQQGGTLADTLAREIEEETGIINFTSDPKPFATVISKHQIPISSTQNVGLLLVVYKVSVLDGSAVTLSPEHTTYEWFNAVEAATRLADKYPAEFTDLFS